MIKRIKCVECQHEIDEEYEGTRNCGNCDKYVCLNCVKPTVIEEGDRAIGFEYYCQDCWDELDITWRMKENAKKDFDDEGYQREELVK